MNFEARQGMYAYSFSNWEAEADGFEFKTSLYYTVKFCLKKIKILWKQIYTMYKNSIFINNLRKNMSRTRSQSWEI